MPARPLTDEQKRQIAASTFMLTNPTVAAAYKSDPRVQLAGALMEQGGSAAPVASGGWGIAEGLSRIGSGIAGGLIGRRERERYGAQNERLAAAEQAALAAQLADAAEERAAVAPAPAPVNPLASVAEALSGLPGGQPSPGVVSPSGGAASPMAGQAPMAPAPARQAAPPPNPMQAPALGGRGAEPVRVDAASLYRNGIVPIEGGTDANGRFLTSPKGAVGPGQVMPATGPEAARLAGLPWNEVAFRTDPDYNNALGEAYYTAKLDEFGGDPIKAAAAYNAGAGRVRRALRTAARQGGDWTQYLPSETQGYVDRFRMRLSMPLGGIEDVSQYKEEVPPLPEEEALPEAPTFGDRVRSRRLQIANAILQDTGDLSATERGAILANYVTPEAFDEDTRAQLQRDENISQRDNIGYQLDLSAAQGRNTNVQQARIKAAEDAAKYNRDLVLEQIRAGGRLTLEEARGQNRVAAAQAGRGTGVSPRDRYYWSKDGQERRASYIEGAQSAIDMFNKAGRARAIAERLNSGGITYSGMAGDVRATYDADVAELNAIRNDIVQGKLGGKLGAGISNADVDFLRNSTPLGSGTPPRLVRREAIKYQAAALRQQEYNELALTAFETGSLEEYTRFGTLWNQYNAQVPVFRNGTVNPNMRIKFNDWLKFAQENGGIK